MSTEPVTTPGAKAVNVQDRLEQARRELARERGRVRRNAVLTFVIGAILLCLLAGYFIYGLKTIRPLAEPENLVAFAEDAPLVPGAAGWLKRNHRRLGNKFHASRFYLLAFTLPWLAAHAADPHHASCRNTGEAPVMSG